MGENELYRRISLFESTHLVDDDNNDDESSPSKIRSTYLNDKVQYTSRQYIPLQSNTKKRG